MKQIITVFILIILSFGVHAQNIYSNKFDGCDTQQFALESDSTTAKKDSRYLIDLITKNMNQEKLKRAVGTLNLQIIAYEDKTSCLISYENKTNLKDEEINFNKLKQVIDNDLIWDEVEENSSALIELKFEWTDIYLTRYGMNGNRGFHKLSD